jgi:hypothetical protein
LKARHDEVAQMTLAFESMSYAVSFFDRLRNHMDLIKRKELHKDKVFACQAMKFHRAALFNGTGSRVNFWQRHFRGVETPMRDNLREYSPHDIAPTVNSTGLLIGDTLAAGVTITATSATPAAGSNNPSPGPILAQAVNVATAESKESDGGGGGHVESKPLSNDQSGGNGGGGAGRAISVATGTSVPLTEALPTPARVGTRDPRDLGGGGVTIELDDLSVQGCGFFANIKVLEFEIMGEASTFCYGPSEVIRA